MKLTFVLGMEVLCRVHTQLDLKARMLTLCGDDGSIMEVLGLYKQMKGTVVDCIGTNASFINLKCSWKKCVCM